MSISIERLGQVASVSLVAAGAIFIGVQINHPPLTLEFVGSTEFVARQTLKMIMTVLAMVGITSPTRGRRAASESSAWRGICCSAWVT